MKNRFRKLIIFCLFGFSSLLITGCNQNINPAGGINELITGYVSCETVPLSGIKVTSNYGYTYTDDKGYFEILSYYPADDTESYESKKYVGHEILFSDDKGVYTEIKLKFKTGLKKSVYVEMEKTL